MLAAPELRDELVGRGGRDPREATEVRSVRVTADGSRLPSCEKNDMLDDTLIAVDATERDGGVVLRFITEPNWFLSGIRVLGVAQPPSRGQLDSAGGWLAH